MIRNLRYINKAWWWERNWTHRFVFPMVGKFVEFLGRNVLVKPKTLLILRLDAIGDYVLFRNFLSLIKENPPYKDYHVTLCGNLVWKSLAETFDKEWVDEFIWIDVNKFYSQTSYRYEILKSLTQKGYEVILNPISARAFIREDAIVHAVKATHKIGSHTRIWENMLPSRKKISDKYYTQLVPVTDHNQFEFFINQHFFNQVLQISQEQQVSSTHFPVKPNKIDLPKRYAVIAPGANAYFRRWNNAYFAQVADFIYENYQIQCVVLGSKADKVFADQIAANAKFANKIIDLTGKTSVVDMVDLIGNATLLVANESSGTHIAVATQTPVVCISNGNHFGRFNPYPETITQKCITVYPQEIKDLWHDRAQLIHLYAKGSSLNINSIPPEEVIECVKILLKKEQPIKET
jgi:ADP-heptose:LPS heptosyltransferase